jgi:hypothetical protein
VFALDEPGAYRIEASLPRGDGQETAYAALEVRAPPGELMELSADPDFLKGLAEESGGRLVAEGDLAEVARLMAPREVAADTGATSWQSRWDRAWLLLLTSGLLATEWFLRRRNGLL